MLTWARFKQKALARITPPSSTQKPWQYTWLREELALPECEFIPERPNERKLFVNRAAGSDSNDGLTDETCFKTLNKAFQVFMSRSESERKRTTINLRTRDGHVYKEYNTRSNYTPDNIPSTTTFNESPLLMANENWQDGDPWEERVSNSDWTFDDALVIRTYLKDLQDGYPIAMIDGSDIPYNFTVNGQPRSKGNEPALLTIAMDRVHVFDLHFRGSPGGGLKFGRTYRLPGNSDGEFPVNNCLAINCFADFCGHEGISFERYSTNSWLVRCGGAYCADTLSGGDSASIFKMASHKDGGFVECYAYKPSDDCFDAIGATRHTFYNCRAWSPGRYWPNETPENFMLHPFTRTGDVDSPNGNGSCFKLGQSQSNPKATDFTVFAFNVAWDWKLYGVNENGMRHGVLYNNLMFSPWNEDSKASFITRRAYFLANNINLAPKIALERVQKHDSSAWEDYSVGQRNSWANNEDNNPMQTNNFNHDFSSSYKSLVPAIGNTDFLALVEGAELLDPAFAGFTAASLPNGAGEAFEGVSMAGGFTVPTPLVEPIIVKPINPIIGFSRGM